MSSYSFRALDFFAGSGLVTEGLKPYFEVIWANDISQCKRNVYRANFPNHLLVSSPVQEVKGEKLPASDLAWASFPCQDLSVAGKMKGMCEGTRSSLFFEWLRVINEIPESYRPPVLCVENVSGFLVAERGAQFRMAYNALKKSGYIAGALEINGKDFVPQSRPRSFLLAVDRNLNISHCACKFRNNRYHSDAVVTAFQAVSDPEWIWWDLPAPDKPPKSFSDICQFDAPVDPEVKTEKLLSMLSDTNRSKIINARENRIKAGTGYKRIRVEDGIKKQRFEVRFDGLAGCLRTPNGGSSRQIVVLLDGDKISTRLLTPREAARLMGAPESFILPSKYNEAYWAMGDAVIVQVTNWLAKHLIYPLVKEAKKNPDAKTSECA